MTVHTSYFPIISDPIQLANAGPFTLSCVGEVMVEAADLGSYPQQVTILLGRFRRFSDAMACAKRRGQQSDLCVDALSGFTPNLLIIEDGRKRLCLAGQITPSGLSPCEPVSSDTQAQQVMRQAMQLRSQSLDEPILIKAKELRFRAAALDARLVDPVWRNLPVPQQRAA